MVKHVERSIVYNLVCLLFWRCSALWVIARLWIAVVAGCSGIERCALRTCLVGFMQSFSSVCCRPCVSPARHHTNWATHVRSATTTMDSALQLSIVTGALLSDTHRDAPAQQTEVQQPCLQPRSTDHLEWTSYFSYFLQYTGTVAQN